ncbi:hypothetical protein [uncultured Sphingomonas sp.]|uniref:hypothetical protein n=1 Tax=uncultured Sphingomonas sp. TaxID=158754 RepID=UPI0035CC643E
MATINGTEGADTLAGTSANDMLNGLGGNDLLEGGGGSDRFDGGAGADTMVGSGTFFVDDSGDVIRSDSVGSTVIASANFSTPQQVQAGRIVNISAAPGTAAINLTGGFGPETLTGNDGPNVIDSGPLLAQGRDSAYGLGGDDTYIVYDTANFVFEDADRGFDTVLVAISPEISQREYSLIEFRGRTGDMQSIELLAMADPTGTEAFRLAGNRINQTIVGNAGANVLAGNGGQDTLVGLGGDDTYDVQNTGVVVRESPGEGFDTIFVSSVEQTYVLSAGTSIEAMTLAGGFNVNAIGNELSQRITGTAGNNILNGGGGSDTLVGLGGDDTYLVRGPGDFVIEANGEGADIVYTTVSYNLGENEVEALSTVDNSTTDAIDLIGNFVSQTIVGNYGRNILNGGSGADTLIGLRGDDLYAVGDSRIIIREAAGEGADTVVTSVSYALGAGVSVEVLAAQDRAGTAGLALTGNELGQTLAGTSGADTLDGAGGADLLIGGAGADRFSFTSALGAGNVDAVTDFGTGDRIGLSSAIFGAVGTALDPGEFVVGTAAGDADDRIVYDAANGRLFYDADGNGSGIAVLFALLTPGTALTSTGFDMI